MVSSRSGSPPPKGDERFVNDYPVPPNAHGNQLALMNKRFHVVNWNGELKGGFLFAHQQWTPGFHIATTIVKDSQSWIGDRAI